MHGGRELIYVPPTPEETQEGENRRRDNVTELRRRTPTAVVEDRRDSVIPFPVQITKEERDQPRRQKSGKRKMHSATSSEEIKADRES